MENEEKVKRLERISFVTPFKEIEGKLSPTTSIFVDGESESIDLKFYAGFVGLKPNSKYEFKLFIKGIDLSIKVGESAKLISPLSEAFSVTINTGTSTDRYVEGGFELDMSKTELTACGVYQVDSFIYESGDEKALHSSTSFFVIRKTENE